MMMMAKMDNLILSRLTKIIWFGGAIFFLFFALPHLWGSVQYIFALLSGLVSETRPTSSSSASLRLAFSTLFPTLVLCLLAQLLVLATPFLTTGSKSLIAYYNEREADYLKTVSKRIELSKQLTEASAQLQTIQTEIQQCRALLSQLGREAKALTEFVALSRQSLAEKINQTTQLNDTGDF